MAFVTIILFLVATSAFGGTYWVSTNGAATWANAQSATALDGTNCCSLSTARGNVSAGDTVNLRGGTYEGGILLNTKAGTEGSRITFQSYTGERATIHNLTTVVFAGRYHGLLLLYSPCVSIKDIDFQHNTTNQYFMQIHKASHSVEISNCTFDGGHAYGKIDLWRGDSALNDSNAPTNCWIHGCTFRFAGSVGTDDAGGFGLGSFMSDAGYGEYDQSASYTTIEGCTFNIGGHHNLETYSFRNLIRSNWFHNEGTMTNLASPTYGPDSNGLHGNRNLQLYDGKASYGMFNLVENNRFTASGPPPDDDGGDGLTVTAPRNVIRYNYIANSQNNGVLFKIGGGSWGTTNRFYNNTVVNSGRFENTGPQWQGQNVRWYLSSGTTSTNTVLKNNIFFGYGGASDVPASSANTITNNWLTASGNPFLTDTNWTLADATDYSKPVLTLQTNSPCIDAGIPLTYANGAGSATNVIAVDDALYFQDGTWGSTLSTRQADTIAIGSVTNTVLITSVDYTNNLVTLASPKSWDDNASVWLKADSAGVNRLTSTAPDIGAFESTNAAPSTPTSGYVQQLNVGTLRIGP